MRCRRIFHHPWRFFVAMTLCAASIGQAQESGDSSTQFDQTVERGLEYLRATGQAEDGTFSAKVGPGVTALAVTAALRHGCSLDDPIVKRGLKALEGFVKPDGGIYGSGRLRNYETCVSMVCLAEANKNGQYNETLRRARAFVTEMQYGATKRDPSDPAYGGVGYSGSERPDLSNTAYFIEALVAAETPAEDPAIKAALAFVSRCQNLAGPHNDTKYAGKVNDGGFHYGVPTTKIDPSTSPERFTENGGLRSYGSMSYAGLKSMIFAGLTKDDPRVKATVAWIGIHYAVDSNPGMGSAGLYYYYHTFAAALKASGLQQINAKDGRNHAWRDDLVAELARRQNDDGSWSNENRRWFEGDKNLATSFALLALSYCQPSAGKSAEAKP